MMRVTAFRDASLPRVFPSVHARCAMSPHPPELIRSIRFIRYIRITLSVEASHARRTRRREEPSQQLPDSRFPIPDSRFPVPGPRSPVPDYHQSLNEPIGSDFAAASAGASAAASAARHRTPAIATNVTGSYGVTPKS
jgi:hypothetical protein